MNRTLRILIIEDDKYFLSHLREIVSPFGVIDSAIDLEGALSLLQNSYDLIITDLHLPSGPDGLKVLNSVRLRKCMKIMLTTSEDDTHLAQAYKSGADHVLRKSQIRETLPQYIKSLLNQEDKNRVTDILQERFPTQDKLLISQISKLLSISWQDRSLLITGPTGTGKSVLGKIIADELIGANAPFIHINCSEIPDNLIESELFGHEKGAFTGADQKKIGKLKAADGGVLFLDEVATMSVSMQQKLLKAIEDKTFYPVGSNKLEKSHFILISATCEDLQNKISQSLFREDLYFRLSGLRLHLTSLKERTDDILSYIKLFQKQTSRRFIISNEVLSKLQTYNWPGNLRELKQVIMEFSDINEGVILANHFEQITNSQNTSHQPSAGLLNDEIRRFISNNGLRGYFQFIEKEITQELIKKNNGKITQCMKELKISSSALYRILHENNIEL
jgi:DNA-binding NtrC family response regulator